MNLINFLAADASSCSSIDFSQANDLLYVIRTAYKFIKYGVPVILIIVGMLGLGKAIASQKEDEIKKAQSTLIKQAIAAAIVLLLFTIVNVAAGFFGQDAKNAMGCANYILNGTDDKNNTNTNTNTNNTNQKCDPGFYWTGSTCKENE